MNTPDWLARRFELAQSLLEEYFIEVDPEPAWNEWLITGDSFQAAPWPGDVWQVPMAHGDTHLFFREKAGFPPTGNPWWILSSWRNCALASDRLSQLRKCIIDTRKPLEYEQIMEFGEACATAGSCDGWIEWFRNKPNLAPSLGDVIACRNRQPAPRCKKCGAKSFVTSSPRDKKWRYCRCTECETCFKQVTGYR